MTIYLNLYISCVSINQQVENNANTSNEISLGLVKGFNIQVNFNHRLPKKNETTKSKSSVKNLQVTNKKKMHKIARKTHTDTAKERSNFQTKFYGDCSLSFSGQNFRLKIQILSTVFINASNQHHD